MSEYHFFLNRKKPQLASELPTIWDKTAGDLNLMVNYVYLAEPIQFF